MSTFNGDQLLRQRCLDSAAAIQERLLKGEARANLFWSRHRWCEPSAVCNIGDCQHDFYASEIDVPVAIAYAEHGIFLGLEKYNAASWPVRWVQTIPFDADPAVLTAAWRSFALELLNDVHTGMLTLAQNREQNDGIVRVIELLEQKCDDNSLWQSAGSKAYGLNSNVSDPLLRAGSAAADTASLIAYSYSNPRQAAFVVDKASYTAMYKSEQENGKYHNLNTTARTKAFLELSELFLNHVGATNPKPQPKPGRVGFGSFLKGFLK